MSYAGKNLRYLRKLRGWTQEECANKLKVKRSLIGAYEEERAEPKLEVQKILCDIFKISFEDLLLKDLTASKSNSGNYLDQRRNLKMSEATIAEIQFVPVKAAADVVRFQKKPNRKIASTPGEIKPTYSWINW